MYFLQEKGSDEIVLKAMGRAINKTVMIAELIKVGGSISVWNMLVCICSYYFLNCNGSLLVSEKDYWPASKHRNWINWYYWHMGTTWRRPSSVCIVVSSILPCQILNLYLGVIVLVVLYTWTVWRLLAMFQWSQLPCQKRNWIRPPQGKNFCDVCHLYL